MIRVAIADDHTMFADGIESLLDPNEEFEFVGKAENYEGFEFLLKTREIDVALLDISMPGKNGIELVQEIKENYPAVKTLMLSMHNDGHFIQESLSAGANGYILKNSKPKELENAIKTVHSGANYFSTEVSQVMMENLRNPDNKKTIELSSREMEVLQGICDELTNDEIGEKLFISRNTVKTHRKNLLEKIGVKNTAGLVKFAVENNLLAS